MLGAPFWILVFIKSSLSGRQYTLAIGFYFFLLFSHMQFIGWLKKFFPGLSPFVWPGSFLPISVIAIIISYYSSYAIGENPLTLAIVSWIVGQVGFLIALISTAGLIALTKYVIEDRARKNKLESIIVDSLLKILIGIECNPKQWPRIEFRQQLIQEIDRITGAIQNGLGKRRRAGDSTTTVWLERTTQRIAAALIEKKQWLLTPMDDTRVHLTERLTHTLICVASGNWDSLERSNMHKPSTRQLISSATGRAAQALIMGMFPFLMIWAVQRSPLAMQDLVRDSMVVGAISWATVVALAALNPSLNDEIRSIKDIIAFLPFVKAKS